MKKILSVIAATIISFNHVYVSAQHGIPFDKNDFNTQVAELVSETMSDDYIGSLSLTIDSSIMTLDGEDLKIDNEGSAPVIENDTTLLPIRGVAEAIGCEVEYESKTQSISLSNSETEVNLQIGSDEIEINGQVSQMPIAAKVENDRTLIPLRATTEALGCDVSWEQDTQSITLTKPYQTKRVIVYSENADTTNADTVIVGNGMTVLQFDTENEARKCVLLNENDGKLAEPDYVHKEDSTLSWGTEKIQAPHYSTAYATNQTALTVAVIDTGLDSSHPCFKNRVITGYNMISTGSARDERGHGTHVASTIADVTSGFEKIKILPIKVFGKEGSTTSLIVSAGIDRAVSEGAKVINLSLGGIGKSSSETASINRALNSDVTVITSAGNKNLNLNSTYCTPACIPGVVTVSALNSDNKKSEYSNYGNGIIDISAPGDNIIGADIGGGTSVKSGTSMAAPHISGAIALVRSTNPSYSSKNAINAIKSSAKNLGDSSYYGVGIADLSKLVKIINTPAPATPSPVEPIPSDTTVTTTEAVNITYSNATVYGRVSYSGAKPTEVGIYFGTSPNNMNKVAKDTYITHNKNPFDMWYDINSDAGLTLSDNTTYYWQCYAITDGIEIKGDIRSFVTQGGLSDILNITTGIADSFYNDNATVHGSASYSGSKPTEVGLYFGTSQNKMSKVAKDISITHNKNPFDIWYDLNSEANIHLKSGTRYYYQIYGIQNGKEVKGTINSFTAP
ncbi:MAG: S8 family serine peptidase [Clostridia bacterium]|nr:S8 family serine peptidase [Clostridia bacterium]